MQLAVSIGRELEMSEDALTGLRMAAMIHDIGKINVPGELLSKPGLLSPLERQLINTHATADTRFSKNLICPGMSPKLSNNITNAATGPAILMV